MRLLPVLATVGFGIASPATVAVAANAQSAEVGKSFDCQLQDADLRQQNGLVADPAGRKGSVYIWFGRLLVASKLTNGQRIPLVVDPDRIAVPVGAEYQGFDEWPQKFRLKANDATGSRMLMVEGDKPDKSVPNAFKAGLIVLAPGATSEKAQITLFMTGHCSVAANVSYTEYQKRASQ